MKLFLLPTLFQLLKQCCFFFFAKTFILKAERRKPTPTCCIIAANKLFHGYRNISLIRLFEVGGRELQVDRQGLLEVNTRGVHGPLGHGCICVCLCMCVSVQDKEKKIGFARVRLQHHGLFTSNLWGLSLFSMLQRRDMMTPLHKLFGSICAGAAF